MSHPNRKVIRLDCHSSERLTVPAKVPFVRYCIDEIHIEDGVPAYHGHAVIGTTSWWPVQNVRVNLNKALVSEEVYGAIMGNVRSQRQLVSS